MRAPPRRTPWTVPMLCQTCGDVTSPSFNECQNCYTPLGQPAVTPGLATHAVRGIGLAASIAVGVTAAFYLLSALAPVAGMVLARQAERDGDSEVLLGAMLFEVALSLPFVVAYLTAAVLVIIWTWRARKNIDAFPGALPVLGQGWAIAGWLVPFANFVVPVRVVANIARDSLWRRSTPWLVVVWWAAWLVFSVGERLFSRKNDLEYTQLPETAVDPADFQAYVDYYQGALGRNAIPAIACVVAAASFIVLIRKISAAQQDRIARATPAWPYAPGTPAPGGFAPGTPAPAGAPGTFAPPQPQPQPQPAPAPQASADTPPASPQAPPVPGGTIGA
ncbi:DUF4328 domain-containing protein [Micromonospora sp. U56]|uniref:DUF4328 domain-containing protein n=1 Tax=Micromonospora sp. U56 TaxID=2824900 RepID=UPI0027DCA2DA|nr:DUF4328 domain-containing protein [Micromonospora sp. U56]